MVKAGFGYNEVMDMPWTEAKEFSKCVAEQRTRDWVELASAMRASGIEQKDWSRMLEDLQYG